MGNIFIPKGQINQFIDVGCLESLFSIKKNDQELKGILKVNFSNANIKCSHILKIHDYKEKNVSDTFNKIEK